MTEIAAVGCYGRLMLRKRWVEVCEIAFVFFCGQSTRGHAGRSNGTSHVSTNLKYPSSVNQRLTIPKFYQLVKFFRTDEHSAIVSYLPMPFDAADSWRGSCSSLEGPVVRRAATFSLSAYGIVARGRRQSRRAANSFKSRDGFRKMPEGRSALVRESARGYRAFLRRC